MLTSILGTRKHLILYVTELLGDNILNVSNINDDRVCQVFL